MTVRVARPEDYEHVVRRVLAAPVPYLMRWVLEPAEDFVTSRIAFARWGVATTMRIGRISIDDAGGIAGGRRLRVPFRDRCRAPVVQEEHDLSEVRGAWIFPKVSPECQARYQALAGDVLNLRSERRRTFLIQLWSPSPSAREIASLNEIVDHAHAIRHRCLRVTTDGEDAEHLERAGFRASRASPGGADGRPPLVAWETGPP